MVLTRGQVEDDIRALRRYAADVDAVLRRPLDGLPRAWVGGTSDVCLAEGQAKRTAVANAFRAVIDEASRLRNGLPEDDGQAPSAAAGQNRHH